MTIVLFLVHLQSDKNCNSIVKCVRVRARACACVCVRVKAG